MQSSIFNFLENKFRDPPKYFVCDWVRDVPTYYFSNDISNEANLSKMTEINWKLYNFKTVLHIYSRIGESELFIPESIPIGCITKVPLLKSNLQKAVRRQKTNIALSSVKTLFHQGGSALNELLRRLPIIMLEDVEMHESFGVLIWLMIVMSKNCPIQKMYYDYVLSVVQWMCEHPRKDYLKSIIGLDLKSHCPKTMKDVDFDVLCVLNLRENYGGMKGDMSMIRGRMRNVLTEGDLPLSTLLPSSQISRTIEFATTKTIIPEAIDFHCYGWILKTLLGNHPQFKESDIKKAIWHGGSKYNVRKLKKHPRDHRMISEEELVSFFHIYHVILDDLTDIRNKILYAAAN